MAPTPVRHVDDAERRARLARRHGLGASASSVEDAVTAMTVLHATEPASVHLALRARVAGLGVADVERALYTDRTVVKQGAMRRTIFGFGPDLLPAAWGSAGARVGRSLGSRLAKDLVASGVTTDGERWLAETADAVVELLDGRELSAVELRAALPAVDVTVARATGTAWAGEFPVAPQLLWWLNACGRVVRARNGGHWRLSKPRWTAMASWLPRVPAPLPEREGYAEIVGRWLRTFGPGTEADLVWWLGGTTTAVRHALSDVGAVPVTLDDGSTGWLRPDDLDVVDDPGSWVALLPTLDPTVMGWKGRDFYLGPHREQLFDSVGNAGTTAWLDGRAVGVWVQDEDAAVRVHLVTDVPAGARRRLQQEADRLTAWLDGVRITSVWVSPAMKVAAGRG